jgi:hypothetical protein
MFEYIRSRAIHDYEWSEMPEIEGELKRFRMQRVGYFAVLKRVSSHKDFFDRALKFEPKIIAVFGKQ